MKNELTTEKESDFVRKKSYKKSIREEELSTFPRVMFVLAKDKMNGDKLRNVFDFVNRLIGRFKSNHTLLLSLI